MPDEANTNPVIEPTRPDALETAFYLLDTLAGEGLGQQCPDGRTIEADDTVLALCSAFGMLPDPDWWRTLTAELVEPATPIATDIAFVESFGRDWLDGSTSGKTVLLGYLLSRAGVIS